jgi:regulator of sigma D
LGIGLTAAQAKTMDFKSQTELLSDLYGGAASRNAQTFQGRIDRLKVGFDEAKESIGAALLPIIEKLIEYVFEYGVPIVDKFKAAWEVVQKAIENNKESFDEFVQLLQDYVLPVLGKVFGFLVDVGGKAAATIINIFGKIAAAITPVLNFIIDAINLVIRGLNLVNPGNDIPYLNKIGSSGADGFRAGERDDIVTTTSRGSLLPASVGGAIDAGGIGSAGSSISSKTPTIQIKSVPDRTSADLLREAEMVRLISGGSAAPQVNITINGAIDPEGTARAMADLLNYQSARSFAALISQ